MFTSKAELGDVTLPTKNEGRGDYEKLSIYGLLLRPVLADHLIHGGDKDILSRSADKSTFVDIPNLGVFFESVISIVLSVGGPLTAVVFER